MKSSLSTFLLMTVALFIIPFTTMAAVDTSQFQEANGAYSRNDFSAAVERYESLLTEYGYSPGVLYNLANSYAQLGSIGKAVLNYERALRLTPGDSDIIGNLQLIRHNNGIFSAETSFSERLLHMMSMNQWISLGGLGLIMITGVLLSTVRFKPAKPIVTLVISCGIIIIMLAAISTAALHQDWNSSVVIDSKARLQISPFEGAATAGEIKEGRKVTPKKEHGEYLFVEDETGRTGWIAAAAIEPVIPE
jgi:tetratricopeptide (TPR) repeat protein